MNNKSMNLGAVALSLLTSPPAFADEAAEPATVWDGFSGFLTPDWDRDLSVTLGTKVWLNEWSRERQLIFVKVESESIGVTDTAPDAQESDIEPVPIPQLSVRYKWLQVAGAYYSKTRFDFAPSAARVVDANADPISLREFETSGERYEWDASAGILIHPYVVILGGYKKVHQGIDTLTTVTNFADNGKPFSFTTFEDIDIEGPTIGIAASVPIDGGFGMYGSYAHGFMDTNIRRNRGTPRDFPGLDTTYNVAELGFTYTHGVERLISHLPLSVAQAYAGYRYQRISTDFDDPERQDAGDVTEGFAVGVNLSF